MDEWLSYRLSDFLMFSPSTYFRQFELYNADVWPAHILTLALGAACFWLSRQPIAAPARLLPAILAACWLWVAWGYLFTRYATINWAASYLAGAFVLQAALLFLVGTVGKKIEFGEPNAPLARRPLRRVRQAGMAIFAFAMIVQPLIGIFAGRPWLEAELFGMAPNPTVAATLGLLLAAGRTRWELFIIPALWCALDGATRLAMEAPDFWVMPMVAILVITLAAATAIDERRAARQP